MSHSPRPDTTRVADRPAAEPHPAPARVDVRGPRFTAWVTSVVLVAVVLIATVSLPAAAVLAGLQAVVFTIGAVGGPARHPYGAVFKTIVAPRLSPVSETEPVPPLRFAQGLGAVFTIVAAVAFALGAGVVGLAAAAFALFAALLNAAFGVCLGCLLYPAVTRARG